MNREAFQEIFDAALENAAQNAEKAFHVKVPRQFRVQLEGGGKPKRILSENLAADDIYIDENTFWLLINIMVIGINPDADLTLISMKVTGHGPGTFEKTFQYAQGKGAFKQVLPMSLKIFQSQSIPMNGVPDDFIS